MRKFLQSFAYAISQVFLLLLVNGGLVYVAIATYKSTGSWFLPVLATVSCALLIAVIANEMTLWSSEDE